MRTSSPEPTVQAGDIITLTRRPREHLAVWIKQPGRTAELAADGTYTVTVHATDRCFLPGEDVRHERTVCPDCVHWWWSSYDIEPAAWQPWEVEPSWGGVQP